MVENHDGVALFVGREKLRIFSANSIHVFSAANAGKKEAERYQILDHSEKGVDRGFRFVSSADSGPVGKILQRRRNEMVLIDISDPYGKPVASAASNVYERFKAVMKSFVSGGSKKVLDTTSSLQFRSASQAPMFSLVPLDTKGSTQLMVKCEVNHFEEPGAVIPHARICEGAVGQPAVLPQWRHNSQHHLPCRPNSSR